MVRTILITGGVRNAPDLHPNRKDYLRAATFDAIQRAGKATAEFGDDEALLITSQVLKVLRLLPQPASP